MNQLYKNYKKIKSILKGLHKCEGLFSFSSISTASLITYILNKPAKKRCLLTLKVDLYLHNIKNLEYNRFFKMVELNAENVKFPL